MLCAFVFSGYFSAVKNIGHDLAASCD